MLRQFSKRTLLIIASIVCLTFLCFVLGGCSVLNLSSGDINSANKAVYLAHVNSVSKEIQKPLSDFSDHIKNNDIEGMKESLNEAQVVIDTLSVTDVPEDMKKIHSDYEGAFTQLQASLKDYIQVYSDYNSGAQTTDVLNQRIQTIQNEYNSAINLLNSADSAAAEAVN